MDREEAGMRAQSGLKPEGGYYTNSERITLQKFSLGRITTLPKSIFGSRIVGDGGGGRVGGGSGDGGTVTGGAIVVRPQTTLIDRAQNLQIQNTQQSVGSVQESIDSIRLQVSELNNGINNIATQLQIDSALEQKNLKDEQESERKLAERRIRLGAESELERKIVGALSRPIARLQQTITSLFDRVMGALTTLFFGWLTNQGIETLKALTSGDNKKLEEIKDNVIKNVSLSIAAFAAVNVGFNLLLRTINGLTLKLVGLGAKLALSPFRAIGSLLNPGGKKPPTPSRPGKTPGKTPGISRGPGIFGNLFAGINAFMNARNGEYVDTAMIALSMFGPGKFVKGLMGIGFAADQIAEVFGMNIFGKDPDAQKQAASVVEEALKQKENKPTSSVPTTQTTSESKSPTTPQPSESSMMADDAKQVKMPAEKPASSQAPVQPQTPAIPAPSAEMSNKFQMAWDNRNNPLARGRIESAWNEMTPDQQQQAKTWAESKGYNWREMKLKETAPKIEAPQKPVTPLGTLPEPKPNIIMAGGGKDRTQMMAPQQTPLTDVPLIPSANPDNFYVLYSQLNYNVVI